MILGDVLHRRAMDLKRCFEVLKDEPDFLLYRLTKYMRVGTSAERGDKDEGVAPDGIGAPALPARWLRREARSQAYP